jgi:hypothetical protein
MALRLELFVSARKLQGLRAQIHRTSSVRIQVIFFLPWKLIVVDAGDNSILCFGEEIAGTNATATKRRVVFDIR